MIRISIYLFLLILFFSSCGNSYRQEWFQDQKMMIGDNPAWSAKDFDDSDWEEYIPVEGREVFWVRMACEFLPENTNIKNQGIMLTATGSYEIWFDGHYIGKNGVLASSSLQEVPGKYVSFYPLADSLTVGGKHMLALRMTKATGETGFHVFFVLADYFKLVREPLEISVFMFLFAGAFLLTAIYFFFMYFSSPKEVSTLIFSIVCLMFFGLLMMEYLKFFYLYEYPFQRTRLEIIGWIHMSLAVLVPLFLMLQFSFPYKKTFLAVILLVIALLDWNYHYSFDWKATAHNQVMWIAALAIGIFATAKKMRGAKIVLTGLISGAMIINLLPYVFRYSLISDFDVSQFVAFVIIVLSMLYIMTVKRREERLAYEASLVLSERLKNELLKKNIKPHFIMNTLTSLIDWVEESPEEGVKFITALADEFDTLNAIADYKLVPIEQEIKLCKNHLKVMGYRKEIEYQWEEKGIEPNEIIPPAIIHTAVENGVTHSLPNAKGVILFRLIFERDSNSKRYILRTLAENRTTPLSTDKKSGTGMKYIQSRLQESYANQWRLTSHSIPEGWETVIEILS